MDDCPTNDCMAILLVGQTRQGKSATGNSILQNRTFNSTFQAVKNFETFNGFSTFRGRKIQVVDTPGLCEARIDNEEEKEKIVEAMSYAISLNPVGYHAIIVVINFRLFTNGSSSDEDLKVVKFLKNIFGSNFMRDRGILLFTGGDYFRYNKNVYEEKLNFEMWLARQTDPYIQLLREECGSRAILFDNRCIDRKEKERQVQQLIDMIDSLTDESRRHSNETFQKPEEDSEPIMKTVETTSLKDEQINELSISDEKMGQTNKFSKHMDHTLTKLVKIEREADLLLKTLKEEKQNASTLSTQIAGNLQMVIDELLEQYTNTRNKVIKMRLLAELKEVFKQRKRQCSGYASPDTEEEDYSCKRDEEVEDTSEIVMKQEVELQNRDQYIDSREFDEMLGLQQSEKDNHFQMNAPLELHEAIPGEPEEDDQSQNDMQFLIEQEEEAKRRLNLAKEAYDMHQAQLASLDEERMRILLESEEQRQIIEQLGDDAKRTEHPVLQNITQYMLSIIHYD